MRYYTKGYKYGGYSGEFLTGHFVTFKITPTLYHHYSCLYKCVYFEGENLRRSVEVDV